MTASADIITESVALAEKWQNKANKLLTSEEKAVQQQMMRLIRNPMDKVILTCMIDQSFRSHNYSRVANQVSHVLGKYGIPSFFSLTEKLLMRLFLTAGIWFPALSVPKMIDKIRADSARSIIPGEKEPMYAHLGKRKQEGIRMNINHLGEAVLGETEALSRLNTYIKDMEDPEIEYISVKISTIFSQISSLAFENTVSVLVERLTQLYTKAQDNVHIRKDGTQVPKFVNLDMEEYRDLEITLAVFMRTLDQPVLHNYSAGIVLQAYLPDAFDKQIELTRWAKKRVAQGGAPIKIRLVKGANMEMEMVEAALHHWPLATYDNKMETDANFKRMVDFGMEPENIRAVHLGIASHNLFEQAYAHVLAQKNGVTSYCSIEMLEGMANHIWRAIQKVSDESTLLYAPIAGREEFINAIAYLIRRLDENTAEDNFLRYSFNLKTDSPEWEFLKKGFIESVYHMDRAKRTPNRIQNRNTEVFPEKMGTLYSSEFVNEADTDWSLPANRIWAQGIRAKWMKGADQPPEQIPIVVADTEIFKDRETVSCFDPNRSNEEICMAVFALANVEDADRAISIAKADPDGWRSKSLRERHEILSKVAVELRKARGDLIGCAAADTGKIFTEADPEISEAVDFAEFYPWSARIFEGMDNLQCRGRGVGLVITPWNFPVAIPCGGIVAALAAGNTVIFKPASSAVMTAWHLCRCFWRAGVSRNTLQFVPCSGSMVGPILTNHPDVDFIILTGGTDTGLEILKNRPDVLLAAETGGKNATIVTAMADRDQAIKHILHSAFSNSGQKCSATSLAILEKEVFEDERFKKQLKDAAQSYATGSAWAFRNRMAGLIHPPKGDLLKALTTLEPGEEWLLEPQNVENNPHIWSPGIKWNVQPGSYTHMTEFFGPVLAVMKADNLEQAIQLVNRTGYGLTSGLESLDEREQNLWKEKIEAGNLYINRVTTGAIVLRQPFGGMKKSALGAGIKAGSPNYVSQFMEFEERDFPASGPIQKDYFLLRSAQEWEQKLSWGQLSDFREELTKIIRAIKSYIYAAEQEFFTEKDYFRLRGEDNVLRYRPVGRVLVRIHPEDTLFETAARIAAVKIAGSELVVSLANDLKNSVTEFLVGREGRRILGHTTLTRQSDDEITKHLSAFNRIRYAAPDRVPDSVFAAAAKTGFYISRNLVMMEGRIEMLNYFQEQTVSNAYHRYGNLGERGLVGSAK